MNDRTQHTEHQVEPQIGQVVEVAAKSWTGEDLISQHGRYYTVVKYKARCSIFNYQPGLMLLSIKRKGGQRHTQWVRLDKERNLIMINILNADQVRAAMKSANAHIIPTDKQILKGVEKLEESDSQEIEVDQ